LRECCFRSRFTGRLHQHDYSIQLCVHDVPLSKTPFTTLSSMPPSWASVRNRSEGGIPRDRMCFRVCKKSCFCSTTVACLDAPAGTRRSIAKVLGGSSNWSWNWEYVGRIAGMGGRGTRDASRWTLGLVGTDWGQFTNLHAGFDTQTDKLPVWEGRLADDQAKVLSSE